MLFTEFFGEKSYQNESFVVIDKSNLNLIPRTDNSAESLFAAIILRASYQFLGFLTDPEGNFVTDSEGSFIAYDNRLLFETIQLKYFDKYFEGQITRDVFEFIEFVKL